MPPLIAFPQQEGTQDLSIFIDVVCYQHAGAFSLLLLEQCLIRKHLSLLVVGTNLEG